METSFIPKKDYKRKGSKKGYVGFLMLVSIIIFAIMIIATVSVFFYSGYLETEITNKSISLEREKGGLDLELIQELSRSDARLEYSKEILESHINLVPLFDFLEENTLRTVMFEKLSFQILKDGNSFELSGEANSYMDVALQADIFGKSKNIMEPIFSDLGVNPSGKITFLMKASVNSSLISYRNSLSE